MVFFSDRWERVRRGIEPFLWLKKAVPLVGWLALMVLALWVIGRRV